MSQAYGSIVTPLGATKIAQGILLDEAVGLTYFAIGDGGGDTYALNPTQTDILNEVYSGQISNKYVDPGNPRLAIIEFVVDASEGGWWARELAIRDESENTIAIATIPPAYKPLISEGSAREMFFKVILDVENAEILEIVVDPNAVLSTKKYVDDKVGDLESSVGGIKASVGGLEGTVGGLESSVGGLQTSISNLESSLGTLEALVNAGSQGGGSTVITKSGAWTCPETGLYRIELCGGGSGGDSGNASGTGGAGGKGGNGGGYSCAIVNISANTILNFIVGAGGAGAAGVNGKSGSGIPGGTGTKGGLTSCSALTLTTVERSGSITNEWYSKNVLNNKSVGGSVQLGAAGGAAVSLTAGGAGGTSGAGVAGGAGGLSMTGQDNNGNPGEDGLMGGGGGGGGGGCSGYTGTISGAGGKGGNGLVIITKLSS